MRTLLLIPFLLLSALVIAFWLALGQYYLMHLTPEQIHVYVTESMPWIRLSGILITAFGILVGGGKSALYGDIYRTLLILVIGFALIGALLYI
jgi:hypothetical protein